MNTHWPLSIISNTTKSSSIVFIFISSILLGYSWHSIIFSDVLTSQRFTSQEILKKMWTLDVFNDYESDGILPLILSCATAFTSSLQMIYQRSFDFPKVWNTSSLLPIYKPSNKSNVENYGDSVILSAFPKLFDRS